MSETLWALLSARAAEASGRPALIEGERVVSYGELVQRAEQLARGLRALRVGPGDRVCRSLPPSADEVACIFAAARLGAVSVGVHPSLTATQQRRALQQVEAKAWVTTEGAAEAVGALPGIAAVTDLDEACALGRGPLPPCPAAPEQLAALFTTSGSTGAPKAVMHSHSALTRCGRDIAGYLRYQPDERILALPSSCFHYGFSQLTSAFAAGACVVLSPSALPGELLGVMARHAVTAVAGLPMSWTWLTQAALSGEARPRLRLLTNAGGALSAPTLARLPEAFPGARVHLLYGMTEALRSAHLPPERLLDKPGALGWAAPGVRLEVITDGRRCEDGEVGELVHAGAHLSAGYWRDPEASARVFRPCPPMGAERACWSGDLVRRDEDGCLWYVGRSDERIKTSGFRLSPSEVEGALLSSGLLVHAVAYGAPDEALGERVEAVVTTPGDAPLDARALRRHLRRALAPAMQPRAIHHWTGPLPTTPSGKPKRAEIAAAGRAGLVG